MADVASATGILNGNLGNILNFLSAAAGLGTAAMGLVDASKAICGGPSNFGFCYIKTAIAPFLVRAPGAATAFGKAEVLRTLKANWLNGVAKADQKAKAKALIHLGLTQGNATALATAAGVDPATLGSLAQKVSAGIAPTQQEINVLGQFDVVLGAVLDAAYERADQQYRNRLKGSGDTGGGCVGHNWRLDRVRRRSVGNGLELFWRTAVLAFPPRRLERYATRAGGEGSGELASGGGHRRPRGQGLSRR